jgi:HD-GYP domain-containing protein (c-di-GMP phosphodiesterase class II)
LSSVRDELSRSLGTPDTVAEALGPALGKLHDQLSLVLQEHAGMAEELLRAYEQLGILFEVTRRLPTVHTEAEVVCLFIDSLAVTYYEDAIATAYPEVNGSLRWIGSIHPAPAELDAATLQCVNDHHVTVETFTPPAEGIKSVLIAPVFAGGEFICAIALARRPHVRRFEASDMSLLEALVSFCGDLIRNHRLVLEIKTMSVDVIRVLVSTIDQKDPYTSGHSQRVGYYAALLGRELSLSDRDLQMLEWAALLHDVGKIGIRDEVLNKQGKLTDEEFEHIREHPVRSYEVVRQVPQLQDGLDGIRYHHERYDGKGYPDGLAGEDIPLQARIVQVADIFDALTTSRAYRRAFPYEQALAILREEAGTVVDPRLVEIFEQIIRREVTENGLRFECCDRTSTPEEERCASPDPDDSKARSGSS